MPRMKPFPATPFCTQIFRLLLGAFLFFTGIAPCSAELVQAFSKASSTQPPSPWHVNGLDGSNKPVSQFEVVTLDGERVLRVVTDKSYGTLRHDLPRIEAGAGTLLRWRWRLDQPLRDADPRRKSGDDSPLKVCALFDMPTDRLGFFDRAFLFGARRISQEYVPAATLCYVWDHGLPVGTQLPNAFTRRVRYVVLNSGDSQLRTWVPHERDLATDFVRAFGAESNTVPPLIGLVVGADADNTAASSLAYVGDVALILPPPVPKQ
jgi:hypothetical protein